MTDNFLKIQITLANKKFIALILTLVLTSFKFFWQAIDFLQFIFLQNLVS